MRHVPFEARVGGILALAGALSNICPQAARAHQTGPGAEANDPQEHTTQAGTQPEQFEKGADDPPIQRPSGRGLPPAAPPDAAPLTETTAPSGEATPPPRRPEDPASPAGAGPPGAGTRDPAGEPPNEPVATPATEPEAAAADILAPSISEPTTPPPRVAPPPRATPGPRSPGHVAGNPARLTVTGRLLFANVGLSGEDGDGGRLGGLRADLGVAWNHVGIAGTVSAWGGRVGLADGTQFAALVGGGPTLGLGRLSILDRGVLDARLGYDFYWSPGQDASGGRVTLAPHGPRLTLDLALQVAGRGGERRVQAFGASAGYQVLVHDLTGIAETMHILSIGLVYWLG